MCSMSPMFSMCRVNQSKKNNGNSIEKKIKQKIILDIGWCNGSFAACSRYQRA